MDRLHIKTLLDWHRSKSRQPLILRGARQVGKTHLVNAFAEKYFSSSHVFNFESDAALKSIFKQDFNIRRIIDELAFKSAKPIAAEDLIFFDEIQECPEAITALKYFAEQRPEQPVISAGSLLGVTLNESSYPVGKVDHLWLGPLNFEEFLLGLNDDRGITALSQLRKNLQVSEIAHQHLWEQFRKFYVTGGLPKAVVTLASHTGQLQKAFQEVRQVQQNLIRDYQSDFSKHSAPANAVHIRAIFENVPLQLSSVQDGSSKKFKFGEPITGKKGYSQLKSPIEWLDKAGLVYKVNIANKAQLPLKSFCKENFFKLFIFDSGLLGAMLNLPPEVLYANDYGSTKGYFSENICLQALIQDETNMPVCWMEGQSEIEFLIIKDGQIIPVEVKSSLKTKAKSLDSYIKRYQPRIAIKFYAGRPLFSADKRIYNLPLYLAWDISQLPIY